MHRLIPWLAALLLMLVAATPVVWAIREQPAPPAGSLACAERITNGDFEAGTAGWYVVTNDTYALVGTILPHMGQQGAILAARNGAEDELSQDVTLPAGNTANLTLWWYVVTEENTAGPWDQLDILVIAGTNPVRLERITDDSPAGAWYEMSLDLSAYAGQTVRLALRATTDSDSPTDFYVDDVSVITCDAVEVTATPTVTVTPGATPTPTATSSPDTPSAIYLPVVIR